MAKETVVKMVQHLRDTNNKEQLANYLTPKLLAKYPELAPKKAKS